MDDFFILETIITLGRFYKQRNGYTRGFFELLMRSLTMMMYFYYLINANGKANYLSYKEKCF